MEDNIEKPTIEQVTWIFDKLYEHLQEGGTFRYLIYDRMGFGESAYVPLCKAGGVYISNALIEEIRRVQEAEWLFRDERDVTKETVLDKWNLNEES